MPEQVGYDEVEADGSVKGQVIFVLGFVAEGNEVEEIVEEIHGDVKADPPPVEVLSAIVNVRSVEGRDYEEGDDRDCLNYPVGPVGAHLVE